MMVSSSVLLSEPTCSTRQNGARCSLEVINTIYGRMAQPSTSLSTTTEAEDTSDEVESPRCHVSCPSPAGLSRPFQRSPHPFSQAVGLLCDFNDFDVLEMLGEGFFCRVLKVSFYFRPMKMIPKLPSPPRDRSSPPSHHSNPLRYREIE